MEESHQSDDKSWHLGFTYLDPVQFHEYFAADLSAEQAAFIARSQAFDAADNFKAVYHDSGVEKQTELDVSSDERSNHQSGLGAVVCSASQEP